MKRKNNEGNTAMNASVYQSPVYRRSRWAYTIECAFEYFVALMVADSFLANLLSHMGIDDSVIGIISSLISLAFLFQLAAILVVQRITNVKKVAVPVHCISQLFFLLLYLLPFLPIPPALRTAAVIICVLIGYFGNYLVVSVIFKWGNSYVNPQGRANFAATKEMISLLAGTLVSLGIGYAVDSYTAAGNLKGGFLFIAIMMLLMTAGDFVCLMLMQNQTHTKPAPSQQPSLLRILRSLFSNKSFVCVIVLGALWNISTYMSVGFMGIYKTKELAFTVGAAQIINIAGCLARFALSKPIAKYTDRRTYAKGIKLGIAIACVGYLVNIFTTPSSRYLIVVYTILHNVAYAGTAQNLNNIVYSYVEPQYFVEASAIKNSIAGLCGFFASLFGGYLLNLLQRNGNMIFGIPAYGQQLLSAISLIVLIGTAIYVSRVVEKQPVIAK